MIAHADADKDKLNRLNRLEVNKRITFDITVGRSFPAFISRISEDGASFKISFEVGGRRNMFTEERYCRVCNKTTSIG